MGKIQLLFPLLPANSRSTKANEAKEGDLQCIGILTMNWDRIQLLKKKTLHGFEMPRQPHFIKHNRTAWESVCQNTLTVFNSQFLDHLLRLSFWYKTALLPCLSIMRSFKYCSMSFLRRKASPRSCWSEWLICLHTCTKFLNQLHTRYHPVLVRIHQQPLSVWALNSWP